jgi:AraC-like DNA-binding protein
LNRRPNTISSTLRDVVAINPRASELGSRNAILTGTGSRHYVPEFEGCLSLKTIVSGSASWEAGGRTFVVHENSYLILNDRQHYSMTIDAPRNVTTFCIFFQRGFVEDVFHSLVTPANQLLDAPDGGASLQLGFLEKLATSGNLLVLTRKLRHKLFQDEPPAIEIEERFYEIALQLVREHQNADSVMSKLPAVRSSTRSELYRRLLRGRDHLLSSLDKPVRLTDTANAACLSPYHFHRLFTKAFGETPQRYLSRHRLDKAASLLASTDRSVTEVCLESGFESPTSFSASFRRQFGMSPRDFRRAAAK